MAESRIRTLREVFRPKVVKAGSGGLASLFAYDAASNQFALPKIPAVWGMSGSLLPWWGWLLILQAIFVYALFEYVRRIQMPGSYDDGAVRAEIAEVNAFAETLGVALEKETTKKIDAAVGDTARQLQELLETVRPALRSQEALNKATGERIEAVCEEMQALARQLVESRKAQDEFQAKMERWVETTRDSLDRRLDNIDLAFAALSNREWHQRLLRELEEGFEALAKPVDEGRGIPDWGEWQKDAKSWRGKLDQWLVIAEYYAMGTVERVLSQPEHLYEGDWTFDEKALANATQVHRFKELAIWWHNTQEAKARVDRGLSHTIFHAPSKKGRLDAPPRIDLE